MPDTMLKWKFVIPNENKNVSFLYTNDYFHFLQVMPKGLSTIRLGMNGSEASMVQ